MRLINLSPGGAALAAKAGAALPQPGQAGVVQLEGSIAGLPCTVIEASGDLIRLRFLDLGDRERDALERALGEAAGQAAGRRAA